jgi:surface protein
MEKHTFKKLFFENFLHKAILAWWVAMFIYQSISLVSAIKTGSSLNFFSSVIGLVGASYLINHFYNKYKPKHKWQLRALIKRQIKRYGPNCDLNHINVSRITDMSILFYEFDFTGDISKWDVSNVTDMSSMFSKSNFNGDISKWATSKVSDMSFMFADSQFNGDISNWDVSSVVNMSFLFNASKFNGDISKWNVAKVTNMEFMFYNSEFTGDIEKWDVSKVDSMAAMFSSSKFKEPMFQSQIYASADMGQDDLLPLPYWANYEDSITRKNAVINRNLHKDLSANLKGENKQSKKSKL